MSKVQNDEEIFPPKLSVFINLLAYADGMVLLAHHGVAMQSMLNMLQIVAHTVNMSFNTKKTVCMMLKPKCKRLIVSESVPAFVLDGQELAYVHSFTYLGHIIDNSLHDDLEK